jgi:hypothetical protein
MSPDTPNSENPEPVTPPEGWGWPGAAAKPHYFVGTESLCGRWWFTGPLDAHTGTTGPRDCTPCARKLAKRAAA